MQRIAAGSIVLTQSQVERDHPPARRSVRSRYGADLIDELQAALSDAVAKMERLEAQLSKCGTLALPAETGQRS
jgi:hypothetical protein